MTRLVARDQRRAVDQVQRHDETCADGHKVRREREVEQNGQRGLTRSIRSAGASAQSRAVVGEAESDGGVGAQLRRQVKDVDL